MFIAWGFTPSRKSGFVILSVSYDNRFDDHQRSFIENRGHRMMEATSFGEALELAATYQYDVVILGASVPHWDRLHISTVAIQRHGSVKILCVQTEGVPNLPFARGYVGQGDHVGFALAVEELERLERRQSPKSMQN
jgi:DNA-binding NtrC family response regulator